MLGSVPWKDYFCFMMKRRQDLILRKVGEDHIMVDPGQGKVDLSKVHTFNETAAWVWEQLSDKPFTVEEIRDILCERYEVSEQQAQQDADTLAQEFEKAGLLEK